MTPPGEASRCAVGVERISIRQILGLARGEMLPALDEAPAYRERLVRARRAVESALAAGRPIYGVTTGVGASVGTEIPDDRRGDLPVNLVRFHGCGTGRILGEIEAAAVVAVRLVSLSRGYSGVREEVLQRLCDLLEARLLPRIPEEGSVGASGDLTPLSYLAATLVGEREVTLRGEEMPAADALARAGLEPLRLAPKESLSLMNGTSVMTALGCLAVERARRLARLAARITAMNSRAIHGNPAHFDARLFERKPHPGMVRCAQWIREDLDPAGESAPPPARLQDRYSIRCAPHVIGVILDGLDFAERTLEIELNGVDDNPLVDPETGDILHGGNFYGGHVAFVMDGLKAAVASVADLLDRQLIVLCTPDTNGGLPENLVAAEGAERAIHHGFKAMQITASALTAEAQKLTMPAAAFSRSTESHNQDKVSMGTIAAREAVRALELAETVAAVALLAACQGLDLRAAESLPRGLRQTLEAVRKDVAMVRDDRRQDVDIERVLELHRSGALPIGDQGDRTRDRASESA